MRKMLIIIVMIILNSIEVNAAVASTFIVFEEHSYCQNKNHTLHINYKYKDDEKIYKFQVPLIKLEEDKLFEFESRDHEMPVVEYIKSSIRTGPVNTNEGIHKYFNKIDVNKELFQSGEIVVTFMKNGNYNLDVK